MAYYPAGMLIPSKLHLIQGKFQRTGVFRFLDLPGEIRNKVYEIVFEDCVVDVKMGSQAQFHDENIDRPSVEYQRPPYQKRNNKRQPRNRKPMENQPDIKNFQPKSNASTKSLKQTPISIQNQPCVAPYKYPKPQHYRRGGGGRLRMSHSVLCSGPAEDGNPADYVVPFNFMLSNRMIYKETLCFLYAKTVFCFTTTPVLDKFLRVTPPKALQAIKGLEIVHETQGEPELTENRRFKVQSDNRWFETCKKVRDKMTDLKTLRLKLILNDWPIQLEMHDEWAQAILCLRRNGLDRVDAVLIHSAFSNEKLWEAARNLEIAMMNKEGRMAKFAEEKRIQDAKKKSMALKARKVLIIRMNDVPKPQKMLKACD
jgi:hypothetical protein